MAEKYQRGTDLKNCPDSCANLRIDEYPSGAELTCLVSADERCPREDRQERTDDNGTVLMSSDSIDARHKELVDRYNELRNSPPQYLGHSVWLERRRHAELVKAAHDELEAYRKERGINE